MRIRGLLTLFALMATACGGDGATTTTGAPPTSTAESTTTTTDPGFVVTSDDGNVTLEVPVEAMATDPGITITVLAPEDYPPELANAAQNPNTRIYRLQPDALVFDSPARLTRTIDVTNFGDVGPGVVPIAVLLVRNPDGEYAPLDDLHVMRRGDQVELSGDITHFSTLVTVSEQQWAMFQPDSSHSGYATETGVDLFLEALFFAAPSGEPLMAPAGYEPYLRSRSGLVTLGTGSPPAITCVEIGEGMPRVGYRVDLRVNAPSGTLGLRTVPGLVPDIEDIPILVKSVVDFRCLDPYTSLVGTQVAFNAEVDHPGGKDIMPGGDFLGGFSGLFGWVSWTPRSGISAEIDYIGLICDINGNGLLDADDAIYQPFPIDFSSAGLGSFALPLFGMADYFAYGLDSSQFSGVITTGPAGTPLMTGLMDYHAMYEGTGRFESAIAVFGSGVDPLVFTVGPAEDEFKVDPAILMQVWKRLFQQ